MPHDFNDDLNKQGDGQFSQAFRSDFYRLIEARKSIRKFKTDAVPTDTLNRIIDAGLHAPSGKNLQNWRFFVLTGRKLEAYVKLQQKSWLTIAPKLKSKLKLSLYEFTERFFYTLGDAPIVILCYSLNDRDEQLLTSMGSVYMAVENMNLAAVAEGLGCCTMGAPLEIENDINQFVGVVDRPEFKEGRLKLLCAVVLGYADHEPPKAARQREDRVTWLE
jgi:nitroreductase